MGAGDNSTVRITINVVDANSGQVISQTTKNLTGLGAAGKNAGDQVAAGMAKAMQSVGEVGARTANVAAPSVRWMNQMGDAGARVGTAGAPALRWMNQVEGHSASALDKVRLLSQEFGLRLPRALEAMLSRMPAVTAAIGSATGAIAGFAVGEVIFRLAESVYDLGQKFIGIQAPVDKFYETLKKTSELDFTNTRSLATTGMRMGQSEQVMRDAPGLARAEHNRGIGRLLSGDIYGLANLAAGHSLGESGATASDRMVQLSKQDLDLKHQQALAEIELAHTSDARLERSRQITSETRKQHQIDAENQAYGRKVEQFYGNPAPGNAGAAEQRNADQKADAEAANKRIELANEVSGAVMKARDAAAQAGLQGEASYARKQQDSVRELIAELQTQHMAEEIPARVKALNDQYRREQVARVRELTEQTRKQTMEAQSAGAGSMARVLVERAASLGNIDQAQKSWTVDGKIDPKAAAQLDQQRDNANRVANDKGVELQRQFNERLLEMDLSRATSSVSATERIELETKRSILELRKAWDEYSRGLAANDARRVQGQTALDAEVLKMQQDARRQKADVQRSLLDQTEKMEAEGARRGLTREQEQQRAIVDEYNERMRQIGELRAKDAANSDLYRRQEVAAERIKNGQMVELQRQMRDRLAGTLRGFMQNPQQELKRLGEEAASKYAANLLLRVGGKGVMTPGADGGGGFGLPTGIFGRGRKGDGQHDHTAALSTSVSAASTTLTAATATIHVQQATFTGMAGGSGAALPAAAALSAAGGPGAGGGGGTFDIGNAGALAGLPGANASGIPGAAGGWSSTGGPGVAAAMSRMGMTDAGTAPALLQQGMGMTQDVASLGRQLGAGDLGAKASGGISKLTGLSSSTLGKLGGVAGGAAGLFSAFQSNGGFGGALSGAMAGAQLGSLAGPIGTGVGAAAGALLGFLGFGGASKAQQYYDQQVKPRIANDIGQYGMGAMDYNAAYDDLVKLDKEARQQTKQWGMGGKREWDGHIHPDIMAAQKMLDREQKAGRSKYGMSGAQFDGGGVVRGFGDFASGPQNGWINAKIGETVVHTSATQMHGDALGLMLAGANREQMTNYYAGGSTPGGTMQAAPSSSPVVLQFHSHDAKGAYDLFMDNKHTIREALTKSYAENSGGSDLG